MKIAMVAACPFPASFASSGLIRELSLALAERGHEMHVVTYHVGVQGFSTCGLHIHRIPAVPGYRKLSSGIAFGKPILDGLLVAKLLSVAKTHAVDIIHAHNYEAPPAGYVARKFFGVPVVYHAHNTMFHELPTYFSSRWAQKAAETTGVFLDAEIPRRADFTIVLSEEQRVYLLKKGVFPERIRVIPPGVRTDYFEGGNGNIIRRRFGLKENPLMIYTGGLQAYQNCRMLVEVMSAILPDVPDAHLIVVARSESEPLRRFAEYRGVSDRIHFVTETGLAVEKDCLAAADVAVIPRTDCIGFPIKILNYMAASRPVVCYENVVKTFIPGKEIIAVPTGDVRAFARAVVRLLKDETLAKQLGKQGFSAVYARHRWEEIIPQIENIYEMLLNR